MQPQTNGEILDIAGSADYIKVSKNTIRNWIAQNKLPAVRVGVRIIRIRKADLDALLTPVKGGEFSIWNR